MGQVPEVLVLGVVGLAAYFQRNIVGLCVLYFLLPGLDVPYTPGGDDSHVRGIGLYCQFKAYLVVALAGAAMADSVRALLLGDLNDTLGYDRPGEGCAQQVLVLIHGPGLHGGVYIILNKLLLQVQHIEL